MVKWCRLTNAKQTEKVAQTRSYSHVWHSMCKYLQVSSVQAGHLFARPYTPTGPREGTIRTRHSQCINALDGTEAFGGTCLRHTRDMNDWAVHLFVWAICRPFSKVLLLSESVYFFTCHCWVSGLIWPSCKTFWIYSISSEALFGFPSKNFLPAVWKPCPSYCSYLLCCITNHYLDVVISNHSVLSSHL